MTSGVMIMKTAMRRRQAQVGYSKVLSSYEQQEFMGYLLGKRPSAVTGEMFITNSTAGRRLLMMCEVLLYTGLRQAELMKLRLKDTPMIIGMPVIEVFCGKGNKDRTIPVADELVNKITGYIKEVRPDTMPRWMQRSDINRPVFFNREGHAYYRLRRIKRTDGGSTTRVKVSTAFYHTLRRIGRHAGIVKPVHPHLFRHTFAVNALSRGVDIYRVQTLMGHSDITMTARYLHLVGGQMEQVASQLYRRF